jgi:hypothetical protein
LTDECPLPSWTHTTVVLKTCKSQVLQFPTDENMRRLPLIESDLMREMANMERETRRMNPRTDLLNGPIGDEVPPYYSPQLGYDPLNY